MVAAVGLRDGAWVRQVHSGTVLRAQSPGHLGEADALWTDQPGLGVVGRSADCPLILVGGTNAAGRGLHGFAHASWRSTVAQITANLLREMLAGGLRPDRARAIICPSAGPCCYEVGPEVQAEAIANLGPVAAQWFPGLGGSRPAFDLWRANEAQMESSGLAARHIYRTSVCTICGEGNYYSCRREGPRTGRIAAISGGVGRRPASCLTKIQAVVPTLVGI